MSINRFIAAALQMCSKDDICSNVAVCKRLAVQAADAGASLVVLPDSFGYIGRHPHERSAVAERVDPARPGPILESVFEIARERRVWVIAGGVPEIATDSPVGDGLTKVFDTCVVVSPDGELTAVYRKLHAVDMSRPGAMADESAHTKCGRDIVVAVTNIGRIGITLGGDVWFPELYRELVLQLRSQFLVVPAAFARDIGAAHWHLLVRARAVENQCYVIAAAQVGRHNDARASYGHSLIVAPTGDIVAQQADGEGVITAEIDLERQAQLRASVPILPRQVLFS